jgi:hypothetical protein
MPVQFVKPKSNPATAQLVAEVIRSLDGAFRAIAPAVEKAAVEMGESLRRAGRRPA